jgi:tubulin monoglycylase TTLL3/8
MNYVDEKEWELFCKDEMSEAQLQKMIHQETMDKFNRKRLGKKKKKKKKKKNKDRDPTKEQNTLTQTTATLASTQEKIRNELAKTFPTPNPKPAIKKKHLVCASDVEDQDPSEEEEPSNAQTTKKPLEFAQRPKIEKDAIQILEELKSTFPQTEMNGSNNIWIVKPAGLSRGRGIKIFGSWVEINRAIRNRDTAWIVQKYIENPALIGGRKFDIRQWIMVTDWNPLTVWFYEECYIRYSASEFTLDN